MFPWAKFRRAKGGVKAHVLLDHDDYLPAYVLLTEAKRSDVKLADSFHLNPGSIVAIDRGYIDSLLSKTAFGSRRFGQGKHFSGPMLAARKSFGRPVNSHFDHCWNRLPRNLGFKSVLDRIVTIQGDLFHA